MPTPLRNVGLTLADAEARGVVLRLPLKTCAEDARTGDGSPLARSLAAQSAQAGLPPALGFTPVLTCEQLLGLPQISVERALRPVAPIG